MRHFLVVVLLFIGMVFSMNTEIAASGTVKGTIIDSKTKEGMEFVNVSLKMKGDSTIYKAVMTDLNGNFTFKGIKKGVYNIAFSFIGYKPVTKMIRVANSDALLSLGSIIMSEDSRLLKGVTVVSQRSQMKFDIDKKVFNVSQDISATGGSATDVLSNIPSVNVDNDGNISLRGNSNVTVWINGKATGMSSDNQSQILDQLPAESIDHIEVITNPSAKYSPEGTAGIINIVLKEDRRQGYFGSVRANVKSSEGVVTGASISYTTKKFEMNADLGYRHMVHDGGGYSYRTNTEGGSDISKYTYLNQHTTNDRYGNGVFLRGNLAYHFNKKDQLYGNGFGILGHGHGNSIINYDFDNPTETIYQSLRRSDSKMDLTGGNVTIGYKHEFIKDHYIDISSSYNKWGMDNSTVFNQTYSNNYKTSSFQKQTNNINNHEWNFQLDYQRKWNDDHKIEAGWKSTLARENSPVKTYGGVSENNSVFDPDLYNRFIYNIDIHAGYFTYTGKIAKLGYQLGLRGEYTDVNTRSKSWANGGEDSGILYHTDYFKWFPSMYLTYSLPAGNELQLNYSRRINRPRGRQLNSFKNVTDSTDISFGNPELEPQYANSFELNYIKNWQQSMLSISTYYRTTDNVIQSVSYVNPENSNIMYTTSMNISKSQSAGAEVVGQVKLFKMLNLTTTWDGYYSKLDGFTYNTTSYAPQERFSWNARVIADIALPYLWSLQLNGNYNSRQLIAQGTSAANCYMDAGLKKSFMNEKWVLGVNVRDLFNSRAGHNYTSGPLFVQDAKNWRNGRIFGLTISYSFGNFKSKKHPQNRNEEETDTPDVGGGYNQ